jgi:hypothetical protein
MKNISILFDINVNVSFEINYIWFINQNIHII